MNRIPHYQKRHKSDSKDFCKAKKKMDGSLMYSAINSAQTRLLRKSLRNNLIRKKKIYIYFSALQICDLFIISEIYLHEKANYETKYNKPQFGAKKWI